MYQQKESFNLEHKRCSWIMKFHSQGMVKVYHAYKGSGAAVLGEGVQCQREVWNWVNASLTCKEQRGVACKINCCIQKIKKMQKFFVLRQYQYGIFVKFRTCKISRLWCYTACILPQSQSHYLRYKILKHVFLTWAPFSPCIPGKPSIPGEPGGPVGPCKQWAQMEGMKLLLHYGTVSQILLTHHISWRSSSPWRTDWSSWTRWTRGTLWRWEGHGKSCWQCQTLFHLIGCFPLTVGPKSPVIPVLPFSPLGPGWPYVEKYIA